MKMQIGDALNEVIARKRWTKVRLANEIGLKNVSSITAPIQRGNMNVNSLIRILDAAGYKLVIERREDDPERPELPIELVNGGKKTKPNNDIPAPADTPAPVERKTEPVRVDMSVIEAMSAPEG